MSRTGQVAPSRMRSPVQKNARSRRVVVLALLALACLPAAAPAATPAPPARTGTQPRIFLDAATLAKLKTRALANDSAWIALRNRCDQYRANAVEYPDGNDYPDNGGIGEGYQGDGYWPALMDVSLCYQVATAIGDGTRVTQYGAVGAAVLSHMSVPQGQPHFQDPTRDDNFGVRFFAAGMAMGYDWLYPALTPALRQQVATSIKLWLTSYESVGFEHTFPQGNYYAGYYAAKAYAGMALANDPDPVVTAIGDPILSDWLTRVQGKLVQPYYAANLAGGGWSEGWNYGPLASLNMTLPALAAKTALGLDLPHDPTHPYAYPLSDARFLLYFTWPSMKTLEDTDKLYNDENPSATLPYQFTTQSGVLNAFGDPFAAYFASFANSIRKLQPGGELGQDWDLWENFLFWDPKTPMKSYRTLPLSYEAHGLEKVAVRSDWGTKAVWGAFRAGPFTNYPDNGEEWLDAGSLAIINGNAPLLANATGSLMRTSADDETNYENDILNDLFYGNPANADLFNVFYVNQAGGYGQSKRLRYNPPGSSYDTAARTRVSAFHDAGTYALMTGSHLEDMYDGGKIGSWTRTVAYVRPGVFAVYDHTSISDPKLDQWMAFHFEGTPLARTGGTGGAQRYEVRGRAGYGGNVDTVLPIGHRDTIAKIWTSQELLSSHPGFTQADIDRAEAKVLRLEIRPPATGTGTTATSQDWLTVFDAEPSPSMSFQPAPLKAVGERAGVLLHRHDGNEAILLGGNGARYVRYSVPLGPTLHVVGGLKPGVSYTLHYRSGAVDLRPGPGLTADSTGTLSFRTR
jgi:hypothetical protein